MSEFWQRPTQSVVCSSTRRMRNPICNLVYTRLHKGCAVAAGDDRGGVWHLPPRAAGVTDPCYNYKPLKPFHAPPRSSTGLKRGVNESVAWKPFRVFIVLL